MTDHAREGAKTFDPTRPFQTRDGREVTHFNPAYSDDCWKGRVSRQVAIWIRPNGNYRFDGAPHPLDLVNVDPAPEAAASVLDDLAAKDAAWSAYEEDCNGYTGEDFKLAEHAFRAGFFARRTSQPSDAVAAVERLRDETRIDRPVWKSSVLGDILVVLRALPSAPEPADSVPMTEAEASLVSARETIAKLREALEPFATHGQPDKTEPDLLVYLMRNRICDWFGVSDFELARAVFADTTPDMGARDED